MISLRYLKKKKEKKMSEMQSQEFDGTRAPGFHKKKKNRL